MLDEPPMPLPPSVQPAEDQVQSKLAEELQEYKEKYMRALADMENLRKRVYKEKQEAIRFAIEDALLDMLTPMDNLENALKCAHQMSDETRLWAQGFSMILDQFKQALHQQGIIPFNSEGEVFDAHRHEAIEVVEEASKPEGTIIAECTRGYKSGERIIRPARVKITKLHTEEPSL